MTKTQAQARRTSDQRLRLLRRIAQTVDEESGESCARAFTQDYYRDLALDDIRDHEADELARAALAHLARARVRKPGKAKVRVYNPETDRDGWASKQTVVEVINDDMPFLVDSISMAIADAGYGIYLTVHPIFAVERDDDGKLISIRLATRLGSANGHNAESMTRFDIDRISDAAERRALAARIRETLADVRAAVRDWPRLTALVNQLADEAETRPPPRDNATVKEGIAMLRWLADDHFTFLGYRRYELKHIDGKTCIAGVRSTALGVARRRSSGSEPIPMTPQMLRAARSREWLTITKANSRATVHRPGYLDYIGVKIFDAKGRVAGEHRFLGLFTSSAYNENTASIPILRRKVKRVFARSRLDPQSHRGKALTHILERFPRDELFQSGVSDLVRTTTGILNLQERRRVRMFVRRDLFRRYISCLVYVPRDRYNTNVRFEIERILLKRFDGTTAESSVVISESTLARIYIIVRLKPGSRRRISISATSQEIAEAVVTWQDRLSEHLQDHHDEVRASELVRAYGHAFSAAYTEDIEPAEACQDIPFIESLVSGERSRALRLCPPDNARDRSRRRFKLMRIDAPLPLSTVLPVMENLGVTVVRERPYMVRLADDARVSIQEFELHDWPAGKLDDDLLARRFDEVLSRVLDGQAENDGLNRLGLLAGLGWRRIVVLRAYVKYLQQTNLPFSQTYMEQVMCRYPEVVRMLVEEFSLRFDPDLGSEKRAELLAALATPLRRALENVQSLDEDRILRGLQAVVGATLRTNAFAARGENNLPEAVALKIDSAGVHDLPKPLPRFEVFVYSPRVEGIHLRNAPVARGGLRWSDRKEDFRTEVLGLMKAQVVKNALIVPSGAKGGFVVKADLPAERAAAAAMVECCYRSFVHGLLSITDNIEQDAIVPPERVVRIDSDDPYLVVAADKGTASFSDVANDEAAKCGYWLDDAFASGGSVGYDHKKMGITARGAWEAVKRHFREIGIDTQTQPFTVAGIGDMSGDVFGNGMLLSRHIRLLAAFDHRHIFLDPEPDSEASYTERTRLYELARSSWDDYDRSIISKGGGIFDRQAKRIRLNTAMKSLLDADSEEVTPPDLIRLILRMRVDLLWNGGIGTYIKASTESHDDAGDRSNDNVRVDATELRCAVVGEGGNLGLTQRARIEFADNGGRINTDFVDNSAGVDCSDREVNIKILLNAPLHDGRLTGRARNRLLASMTDEVGQLVLRDNYLQTQAISMVATHAADRIMEHAEIMRALERSVGLDRAIEFLPDQDGIDQRRKDGKGLTRPEIAVIVSYAKIQLFDELLRSDVPEDHHLAEELSLYFPARLRKPYALDISAHRLSREITCTLIANSIVNRMGPGFVLRAHAETGAESGQIARAYAIARDVFGMREIWDAIETLDNLVPAEVQHAMLFQTSRILRHATYWLLQNEAGNLDIGLLSRRYRSGVQRLLKDLRCIMKGSPRRRLDATIRHYTELGVPEQHAERVAVLHAATSILDIVQVGVELRRNVRTVAQTYFALGRWLLLDWLWLQIEGLEVTGRWQARARGNMRWQLLEIQRSLTADRLRNTRRQTEEIVADWLNEAGGDVRRAKEMMLELRNLRTVDFATMTVALQELRTLLRD